MNYKFERAAKTLAGEVFGLIVRRIQWMEESGIRQWNGTGYTSIYPLEYYEEKAQRGELYVLRDGSRVMCAAVLLEQDSRWRDSSPAYYVHNFVSAIPSGGAGAVFLEEVERLAQNNGKRYVRLDCAVGNAALNRYYEEKGYRMAGFCEEGGYRGILREKGVEERNCEYLCKDVMRRDIYRIPFDALAQETFGLSFENWYQDGFWEKTACPYQPYTLFIGGRAAANVSVSVMRVLLDGQMRTWVQLGTVMTAPEFRGQGFARLLLEEVLRDWDGRCDTLMLFANQTVLDFYPRFGFERQAQRQFERQISVERARSAEKLSMDSPADRELLEQFYRKKNPFSRLQVTDNYGLLMFCCGSFFKDFIWLLPDEEAVVIAEQDGKEWIIYDIYCSGGRDQDMMALIRQVTGAGSWNVRFAFAPKNTEGLKETEVDDPDNALFILRGTENPFAGEALIFPEISHT